MVAKIVCGKSIRGVISYNELKVRNGEAVLLSGEGFLTDMARLPFRSKVARFEKLTRQNERTKTNAVHISLNFSHKDIVSDEMLQSIARDYMDRIGFGRQPYLVYRHFDAAHPHIHIATVNIAEGGARIETHNIGRNLSEPARKELEQVYGLIKAEDQATELRDVLLPVDLERVQYGKKETKKAISGIVLEVLSSYKFSSLPELNAVLGQFGVRADRGLPGSAMYERRGLVYTLVDDDGQRIGVPIKASSIYSSPTLANLEKKFQSGGTERKPYGQRLKHLLDRSFANARSEMELREKLQAQGIRILLRKNGTGQVYGVTFIDNATRCVFNGSDLGKTFSAKAFLERLQQLSKPSGQNDEPAPAGQRLPHPASDHIDKPARQSIPAGDLPVIQTLLDIALDDRHEENTPDPYRKKRRRLGLD